MASVYLVTKAPIAKSEAAARMSLFRQIMPENLHNNDLLTDTVTIAPNALLGNQQATIANIARINHQPNGVILEAIAHDGYSGDIKLLIAIIADGSLSGVRVLTHKETPGLGDYIDIAKGKWITLFDNESLRKTAETGWIRSQMQNLFLLPAETRSGLWILFCIRPFMMPFIRHMPMGPPLLEQVPELQFYRKPINRYDL